MRCKSTSISVDSKTFHFDQQCDKHQNSVVKRLLNPDDFHNGVFLIVELSNNLRLARINRNGLHNNQIETLIYSPSLPARKLSTSKSSIALISINNVIGCLNEPLTQITTNKVTLSNAQLISIQDICDELWASFFLLAHLLQAFNKKIGCYLKDRLYSHKNYLVVFIYELEYCFFFMVVLSLLEES